MKTTSDSQSYGLPTISDEDIQAVEYQFGLTFDERRREILRSNESFDIQACPGSGKTTLLVGKLAVLAKKWPHSRRGICVLSHTNVARQEIEDKLSGTGVGERLLGYPHFVGTIHGFVNEFLALPLLHSKGRLVRRIDDEACSGFCQKLLYTRSEFQKARDFLRKREEKSPNKTIRHLRYEGSNLQLGSAAGSLPCGPLAPSFNDLLKIKAAAAEEGLWRFDDMFALAEYLLATQPRVAEIAHWRFPAVFIDEMQDTSELQSRVLARIFPISGCLLRQRFGDSNQAIYERGHTCAETDPFPGPDTRGIVNSRRFGQTIAGKIQPFAPDQPQPYLIGEGPPQLHLLDTSDQEPMPHTIFLFTSDSIRHVLPAFAELLLQVFPAEMRRSKGFLARAIGFVGRSEGEEGEQGKRLPRRLGDYWPGYEPRVAKSEPRPERLADFIHLAQRQRAISTDCALAVSTVVRGIFQLIELVVPNTVTGSVRNLRRLRELLSKDPAALRTLENLLWLWCIEAVPLNEPEWHSQLLHELRRALEPVLGKQRNDEAKAFCRWSTDFRGGVTSEGTFYGRPPNRYRFPEQTPSVEIEVGTIHSAKGQTHTATLVLETFSYKHDIGDLFDWLVGDKRGAERKDGVQRLDRLRLIYTAMSRPTHLLCLAMRNEVLEATRDRNATVDALQGRGWKLKFL